MMFGVSSTSNIYYTVDYNLKVSCCHVLKYSKTKNVIFFQTGDGIFYVLNTCQNIQLNRNPTIIIPPPTMAIKVRIKGIFNTFRRIIISGNDKAITDIINAKAVPSDAPFSISTETIGTIPAALE